MKIIHTSDWHLGIDLYGQDRSVDHEAFFDQLAELMATERPDALVVCGDIFDRIVPSQTAQRLFVQSILLLHDSSPETRIVLTAGNHDSASRLELMRPLWSPFCVDVVGYIEREGDKVCWGKHIIEVPSKGYIVALPFVYPHNFPPVEPGLDRQRVFVDHLMALVAERNIENLPVVLMAHMAVDGSDFTGHQPWTSGIEGVERTTVGHLDVVTVDTLGGDYDYLALGHIHKPQFIQGSSGKAYYSGSPFPMSFDEAYPHSVAVVELERGHAPRVTSVPVQMSRTLRTIPSHPAPLDEVLHELEQQIKEDEEVLLRVQIQVDGAVPIGVEEKLQQVLRSKPKATLCHIKFSQAQETERPESSALEMYSSVLDNNPLEIAGRFLTSRNISDDKQAIYLSMIQQVWQDVRGEEQA